VSRHAINWAFAGAPVTSKPALLVLLVLCEHANDDELLAGEANHSRGAGLGQCNGWL
jgi:hypothetical protein